MFTLITRSTVTPWSKHFDNWFDLHEWLRSAGLLEGWRDTNERFAIEDGREICTHQIEEV